MKIGTKVGAKRWPYAHAHPGCWNQPWVGTVVAKDDPRVWQGTIAFPGNRLPSAAKVKAHVEWCLSQGLLTGIPVLWNFDGPTGPRVYWEKPENVVPYADDLAAWELARAEAFALLSAPMKAA